MIGVVLRCDNCGTDQSATGVCEACHEGQVRYFCKNHEPGRWIAGPKCTLCGAEYGVAVSRTPARQSTGTIRKESRSASPRDIPARTTRLPPKRTGGPWGSRPTPEEILESDEFVAERGPWRDCVIYLGEPALVVVHQIHQT